MIRPDRSTPRAAKHAYEAVTREWGKAFDSLGPRFQRALLMEAVMNIGMQQDSSISSDTIRRMMREAASWVIEAVESQ